MTQKSLFKNFLSLFNKTKSILKSKNISETEAINMQQEYIAAHCSKNTNSYPPYLEIAKQLDSPKTEVFNAALYYLVQIANHESRYKDEITTLLAKKSQTKHLETERKNILNQAINYIN